MKIKKIMALALAGILTVGCLSGCGGKGGNNQSRGEGSDVEISAFISGMGEEWLKNVVEAFNKEYPEYNAFYKPTASWTGATSTLGMEDGDTVDLYLATNWTDTSVLEPLDDVLDSKAKGESKTIREKFNPSYLELETRTDGSVYSLTYGAGGLGFVYNLDLFQKAGITQVPRTSDELAAVCATLKDKGITPMLHHKGGQYYMSFDEVWIAQAMGKEAFDDLYTYPTKEKLAKKDGRYDMLRAMSKIITPDYIVAGSNTESHTVMQTKFLAGEAAMAVNGSWLQNEMGGFGDANFLMMKTPVISSIKNRLTTIKNDQALREVIDAVDAVTDGDKAETDYKDGDNYKVGELSVSASDWKEVKMARNSYVSADFSSTAFMPKYSANKEGAKEFLRFLYSDKGLQIYAEATHLPLPLELDNGEYDMKEWTSFEKNQYKLRQDAELYVSSDKKSNNTHDLYVNGGAVILNIVYPVNMCTLSEGQRQTAEEFWNTYIKELDSNYSTWEANIK